MIYGVLAALLFLGKLYVMSDQVRPTIERGAQEFYGASHKGTEIYRDRERQYETNRSQFLRLGVPTWAQMEPHGTEIGPDMVWGAYLLGGTLFGNWGLV